MEAKRYQQLFDSYLDAFSESSLPKKNGYSTSVMMNCSTQPPQLFPTISTPAAETRGTISLSFLLGLPDAASHTTGGDHHLQERNGGGGGSPTMTGELHHTSVLTDSAPTNPTFLRREQRWDSSSLAIAIHRPDYIIDLIALIDDALKLVDDDFEDQQQSTVKQ